MWPSHSGAALHTALRLSVRPSELAPVCNKSSSYLKQGRIGPVPGAGPAFHDMNWLGPAIR